MKAVLVYIIAILSIHSLEAIREEWLDLSDRRPSVFESKARAWQRVRENERRERAEAEAARLRIAQADKALRDYREQQKEKKQKIK